MSKPQEQLLSELEDLGYALVECPKCKQIQVIETEDEITQCCNCPYIEETIFFDRRV